MAFTPDQKLAFEAAARPLIKWLAENVNPHSKVLVTNQRAELMSGELQITDASFLPKD